MNISRWIKGFLLFGLISLPLWIGIRKPFSHAPDSSFTTITGKQIALKAWHGKPVLVTFWATSCQKCIAEMPDLIALYQQFHPQGLEIIAIAMAYDMPNKVVAMSKDKQLPYDVIFDVNSVHTKAFSPIWGTPTTLLISPDGMISKRYAGAFKLSDMQTHIQHLLTG
jgi:thiol-disulfide isomerase/thioredoxin